MNSFSSAPLFRILVDSNFLLSICQFRINLTSELENLFSASFELIILNTILKELQKLSKRSNKLKMEVRCALDLAALHCKELEIKPLSGMSNDEILTYWGIQLNAVVATNDKELRRRLRSERVPVVFVRGRNRLSLLGAPRY